MLWWNPACPVDGLLARFNLAHEQICFLTTEALSFKFPLANPAMAELDFKGNGRRDSDWFIAVSFLKDVVLATG